jgi:hypothetical protein
MMKHKQSSGDRKAEERITIVSGLPRSGTSMMMQILEAGGLCPLTDKIRSADTDNPKGYYEFERVKKLPSGDDAWLGEAQGKVVKVIATLLPYLPNTYSYSIIFMDRAIPEVLASQRKMLVNRGEDPDKISDDALTRLFEKHLNQVNAWLNNQANLERIEIDFRGVIKNPRPYVQQINQFLGGNLEVEKMIRVVDPNLYRQQR